MPPPANFIRTLAATIETVPLFKVRGRVREVSSVLIRATGPSARIGELCILNSPGENIALNAEVVGLSDGEILLSPLGEVNGVSAGTIVTSTGDVHRICVGQHLIGSVLNGLGCPLVGASPADAVSSLMPVSREAPPPLSRKLISSHFECGVRALDGLLTCGEGQRLGIFAAAGVGKSTLLGMLARNANVDVVVIGLIGERGREVNEFIQRELGTEGMKRTVVVCATSERSSMERVKAAYVATTIAEYFRDQGKRVLLLIDSITRFARAMREIGLAAGEPPARRGFPPSVFAALPRLLERGGMGATGSITAFYTVLVEGDDINEPVADETRSILDGHIVLSRKLAEAAHFPAIDVLASSSRVMHHVINRTHADAAVNIRKLMARYDEVELLVRLGEYQAGTDAYTDIAIARIEDIRAFLKQRPDEVASFKETASAVQELAA